MKQNKKQILSVLLAITLLFSLSFAACANDEEVEKESDEDFDGVMMTITGQVNNNFQIITSDGVYEIDMEGQGSELAENPGKKVAVTGYVVEEEGEIVETEESGETEEGETEVEEERMKTITVTSYKILEIY